MRIVDYFKAAAGNAERELDSLVSEQEGKLKSARALAKVERRFEEMAADGVIDPTEMNELRAILSRAREDERDSAADLSFRIQVAANEYTHSEEAASRLMKNEHDAYMMVIKNISG